MRLTSFAPTLVALGTLGLLALPVAAQDSRIGAAATDQPISLTLGETVRLALARSTELARAGYTVDLQGLELDGARAADDLELSITTSSTLRYDRGYQTDFFGNPDGGAPGLITVGERSGAVSTGLQFSLPVYDGGARAANRRAAERALDAGRHNRDRTAEDVASQAATQYLGVLEFEALVAVEEASLAAGRVLLERVEAEFAAGNRNRVDALQQRASIALGEQRLAAARRNYGVAILSLRQTLRLPVGTVLTLAPAPDFIPGLPAIDTDLNELLTVAIAARSDLSAQAAMVEAARHDLRVARAGRFPVLSLSGSVGTRFNSRDDISRFGGQFFDVNPNASLGLSISLPVFEGGRTSRAVERSRVVLSDIDAVLELQQRGVVAAVETAVLDAEAATAVLNSANEAATAAREALSASEERYGVGAGIFLDVLDARRTLVQAEADLVTARYDLLNSRVLLAYHTGGLGYVLVALD